MGRTRTLAIAFFFSATLAGSAHAQPASFTTFSGKTPPFDLTFTAPACPAGEQFLVSHLQASPEVINPPPGFLNSIANARWAVSVLVSAPGGTIVPLTVAGRGVVHLETSIPAGQALPSPPKVKVIVRILDPILAPSSAPGIFNVHVSGFCGVP